jgi:hypothetical protein
MSDTLRLSPYLEAVALDLDAAAGREVARRSRRRPLRIAALVAAGLILVAGTAFAASSLLGDPAPPRVQAALDAYFPDTGEALSPLPGRAQIVARYGDDVLYRSLARDGVSTCTAITTVGAGGAPEIPDSGCIRDTGDPHWPIGILVVGFHGRQIVVGQGVAPAGGGLFFVTAGAGEASIPLGVAGFFLWELPQRAAGSLELRDAHGSTLASMPLRGIPSAP